MNVFQRYTGPMFMMGTFAAILMAALMFTLGFYAFTWGFGIIAVVCFIVSATIW